MLSLNQQQVSSKILVKINKLLFNKSLDNGTIELLMVWKFQFIILQYLRHNQNQLSHQDLLENLYPPPPTEIPGFSSNTRMVTWRTSYEATNCWIRKDR